MGNPKRCSAGLSGESAQNNVTLLFFPDFSPATAIRKKGIWSGFEGEDSAWSPATSPIRRQLNYGTRVSRKLWFSSESGGFYQLPVSTKNVCRSSVGGDGEQRPLSLRTGGRGLMAGTDMVLAAQWGMAGWTWTLAKPIFCFSSLLSPTGICPYISGTTISLLVRLILFFSF